MRKKACVVKRSNGTYAVKQPMPDGSSKWTTVGKRKRDAEALRDEINRRTALGAAYQEPPELFGQFAEAWLDRYRQRVRPKTFKVARHGLLRLASLNDTPLDRLSTAEVEDVIVAIAREHPRTAQVALATIKAVVANARQRGQQVDVGILELRPPRSDERDPRFLTWHEVEEIASFMPEWICRIVPFAAGSGLRLGECLALQDRDVDLDAGRVTVRQSKTHAGERVVDLPASIVQLVREQRLVRARGSRHVFAAKQGGHLDGDRFRSRYFVPATRDAGLEGVTFHDLRHTYISLMASAGQHVTVIAAQVGHADGGSLLMRRYRHLFPGEQRSAAAALDSVIRGVAPGLHGAHHAP